MKNLQKVCVAGLCVLLLGVFSTASAKSKNINKNKVSNAEIKRAYARLMGSNKNPPSYKQNKIKQQVLSRKQITRQKVLATAKKQLRKKYRWGGASPKRGFDCSGLVQYAYKSAQLKLPRTAAKQYRFTKRVSMSRLQTGDLIFFHTRRRSRSRINHVGIYMGEGEFIHAPRRGKRVSISKLDNYWKRRVIGAGRV